MNLSSYRRIKLIRQNLIGIYPPLDVASILANKTSLHNYTFKWSLNVLILKQKEVFTFYKLSNRPNEPLFFKIILFEFNFPHPKRFHYVDFSVPLIKPQFL